MLPWCTRGHSMKQFKSLTTLNISLNFLCKELLAVGTVLPDEVVTTNAIRSHLESKLDKYWRLKSNGYDQRLTTYH